MRTPTSIFKTLAASVCFLFATAASSHAEEVLVTVKNIESAKGSMRVAVFTSDDGFQEKKAYKTLTFSKDKVSNGTLTLRITLPPGEYGISLLDDENENKKMDYNMIHMPKEGFGFSDYYHNSLSMPKYDSFKFKLEDNATKKVTVKMRYM